MMSARGAVWLALPGYRHVPGVNRRPDGGALEAVIALAPAETRGGTAAGNVAWVYGVRLIEGGCFWEAHEVLEAVWRRARPNSRERFLVQALIHLANGALKLGMGRSGAARRLAGLAADCRQRAFPRGAGRWMGIDSAALAAAEARLLAGSPDLRLGGAYAF